MVSNPPKALAGMRRVMKPGAKISAICVLSDGKEPVPGNSLDDRSPFRMPSAIHVLASDPQRLRGAFRKMVASPISPFKQ